MIKIICAIFTFLCFVNISKAEEKFYMKVYGAQTFPNLIRTSHSYVVFTKMENDIAKEEFCISWLPQSLVVRPFSAFPERGINLDLQQTNQHYSNIGANIVVFGSFQIKGELYDMAVKQYVRLMKNDISYICIDWNFRGRGASNCINTILDIDDTQPMLFTGTARGIGASQMIVGHFDKWIIK